MRTASPEPARLIRTGFSEGPTFYSGSEAPRRGTAFLTPLPHVWPEAGRPWESDLSLTESPPGLLGLV